MDINPHGAPAQFHYTRSNKDRRLNVANCPILYGILDISNYFEVLGFLETLESTE